MNKLMLLFTSVFFITAGSGWATSKIVINEIMYNNPGEDVEFVELYNNSTTAINLQNWYILDDNQTHTPCKLSGTLDPGTYLVVVGDVTKFRQKYPGVANINPNGFDPAGTGWSLGNGGDAVYLFDNTNTLHDSVAYNDGGGWPGLPDGNGPSLELLHPALDNALPISWDPSSVDDGTPGQRNSVYTENVPPTCKDGERLIDLPTHSDAVTVEVIAYDYEGLARVQLMLNTGQGYLAVSMNDNGVNGDAAAGDSVYSAIIPAQAAGTVVKYYVVATDNVGQQDTWPNDAPEEYHAYTVDYVPPKLRITEILAVNDAVNYDEFGEYDDWFEIHNEDSKSVNLAGMYVSNNLGSSRSFKLPSKTLVPGEYLVIWADDDTDQGNFHADFRLSSAGEEVGLFETVDHGNVLIHGWKYGLMSADVSMGFKPESGTAPEYLTSPTPGASNESSRLFSPVCINEFQCTSDFGGPDDWIEIYNRGTESFDLSGCFLSDERNQNTKWTFPQGTIIAPGEFLVVYEDVLDFGLSSDGKDVLMLTAIDSTTGLDFYDFGRQLPDKSEGRFPDGSNSWKFFDKPTKGEPNKFYTEMVNEENSQHRTFHLYQNFPNPFNPVTNIKYVLPKKSQVSIVIYDMNGRQVKTLIKGIQPAGTHNIVWEAIDDLGQPVSSGIYLFKIQADNFTHARKMLFIK